MEEKKVNQIEEFDETSRENNNTEKELWEALQPDYPKIELSTPGENSPKIRTYLKDNSYFATKGTCRSDRSRMYSIQDLVTIETSSYCSPDGRDYWSSIDKINLFPSEDDLPEEYDDTTSDRYGSGQYDYLSYDKENKRIWSFSTGNNLASQDHYFWVSPDSTILFPWIETVEPCNGWYFHHIIIDNKSDYKYVDAKSIQETINALFDQKREMEKLAEYREKLEEYRKKYGDIWLELEWEESWWYHQPRVYILDKYLSPIHEHSKEMTDKNLLLVKFGKPWDSINFFWWWFRYTVYIHDDKTISIWNNSSSIHDDRNWWYVNVYDSTIQPWQIFINGEDVYENTKSTLIYEQKQREEGRKNQFTWLKDKLIDEYNFTESEFRAVCKYAWKWNILSFLSIVTSILEKNNITKDEIFNAMKEIKNPVNWDIFQNYILIKRVAKNFRYEDVKRVVDKGYAWSYITDTIKWINRFWNFDDAIAALKLAIDGELFRKGSLVYTSKTKENTISDLWQALIDAGVVSDK